MAKNSSVNLDITNNADGYDISGGTTKRKLTVTGADITITGSGSYVYTFPATSGTLLLDTTAPVKATGAEINTGTDDAKFATPKAIADSKLADYIRGDGWINALQTWTRESDNSFSEPIDATLKYQKGDKLRYKQGAGYKYQYVIGVGAYSAGKTIMTTSGGSDFLFTNGVAITDNYYSHEENPIGFPPFFNWTVVHSRSATAYTNLPTTNSAIFKLVNTMVTGQIDFTMVASAGGTGEVYTSVPVPVVKNMPDLGTEVAATGAPFTASAFSSIQKLNYYNVYPATVIAVTAGYHYISNFRYAI